eukprot:1964570-Rhodomonas_salina.1
MSANAEKLPHNAAPQMRCTARADGRAQLMSALTDMDLVARTAARLLWRDRTPVRNLDRVSVVGHQDVHRLDVPVDDAWQQKRVRPHATCLDVWPTLRSTECILCVGNLGEGSRACYHASVCAEGPMQAAWCSSGQS